MKQKLSIITLLLLTAIAAGAQTYSGTVVNSANSPIKNATVIMLNARKSSIAFVRTGAEGKFSIATPAGRQGKFLLFNAMGYERDTLALESFRNGQTTVLQEKTYEIREVKVSAPRIRQIGDTLNFLVTLFKQKQDRTIEDVLKRIPGVTVNGDGSIDWQGTRINRFYIEGMDLLGDKYTQASQNISADKVKKIQVMENHQPVKLLRNSTFSEQAALNIVLTDDAKNIWQATADVGLGSSLQGKATALSDDRLMAMLFARKTQSISMYKFNNTGKDILHEVNVESIFGTGTPTEGGMLSNINLTSPDLEPQRTTFNTSHVAASNWLFKINDDRELRIQIGASTDRSRQNQRTETHYTDIESGATIIEDVSANSHENRMNGELRYLNNSSKNYVNNTLKASADYDRSTGEAILNNRIVRQNVKPRKRYITDTFKFSRRMKNSRILSLSAYLSYNYLPGRLLLNDSTVEQLDFQSIFWGASSNLRYRIKKINITHNISTAGKRQEMNLVNSQAIAADRYFENRTTLGTTASIHNRTIRLEASLPILWIARSYNGNRQNNLRLLPSLSLRLTPNAHWEMGANYSYSWSPTPLTAISNAPIFTNYISMQQGTGTLEQTHNHALSANANFKHTVWGLFGSAILTYGSSQGNILREATYDGRFYKTRATNQRSNTENIMLLANISKSISWGHTTLSLQGNGSTINYTLLISGRRIPTKIRSGSLTARVSIQPSAWFSFDYSSQISLSKQTTQSSVLPASTLKSFSHTARLYFMPGKWQFEWENELYHSNDPTVSTNYFSDLDISLRQKRYECGLTFSNIFGTRTYQRRYITTNERTFQINRLRPREIIAHISFNL